MRSSALLVIGVALVVSACGGDASREAMSPTPDAPVTPGSSRSSNTIERIDRPAAATTPAERLDDGLVLAWIGGSDLELDGRSLPNAVAARSPTIDGEVVTIVADVSIGPLPADISERVRSAAGRNVDGLIVPMSPSWLTWNGHDTCAGITQPHPFYSCILDPSPGTDVASLRSDVAALIAEIVDTGIPAYLYVIPHSVEALSDPLLADRLTATEAIYAGLDPGADHVTFVGHIVSRDIGEVHEGTDFYDMVHPTASGIERLADFFARELPSAIRSTPN